MNSHELMVQQEKNALYQQMGVSPQDFGGGKITYHRGMNYLYVIMLIYGKIQDISQELADTYIKAGQDIDNIDEALNRLKNDLNNAMNSKANGDSAVQIAKDIQAVKNAYAKYQSDKAAYIANLQAHGVMYDYTKQGAWNTLNDKDMDNFLNMFDNEKIDPDAKITGKYKDVGDLINAVLRGDPGAWLDFKNLLVSWYEKHQNKDTQNGSKDILNQWLNGGDVQTPSSMGSNGMITVMDHFSTQLSGEVNQDQTKITSIFNAGKGTLDQIIELNGALVQNQARQ